MSAPDYSDRPNEKPGCRCAPWDNISKNVHGVSQSHVDSMFLGGKAPSHDNCARPPLNNSMSEKGSWCYCLDGGTKMCSSSQDSKITTLQTNGTNKDYYKTNDGMYLAINGSPKCLQGMGSQMCPSGQERGYGQVVSSSDSGAVVYGEEHVCPDTACMDNGVCTKQTSPSYAQKKEEGSVSLFDCSYLENQCDSSSCDLIAVGNKYKYVKSNCGERTSQATCTGSCEFKNNKCQDKPKSESDENGKPITFSKKDGYVVAGYYGNSGTNKQIQVGNYNYQVGNRKSTSARKCLDDGFNQYGQYCAEPILRCIPSGNTYVAEGVTPNFSEYAKQGYRSVYQCVDGKDNIIKGLESNADSFTAKDPIPNILFTSQGASQTNLYCLTPPDTNRGTPLLENYSSHLFIKDVSFFTSHVPDFYWYSTSSLSSAETFQVIPKRGLNGIKDALNLKYKQPQKQLLQNIWFVDGNYSNPETDATGASQSISNSLFDFKSSKKGAWVIRNDSKQTIGNLRFNLEFITASGDQYMDGGRMTDITVDGDNNNNIRQVCGTHAEKVFMVKSLPSMLNFWYGQATHLAPYSGFICSADKQSNHYHFKVFDLLTEALVFPNNIRAYNERARVIASDGQHLFVRAHLAVFDSIQNLNFRDDQYNIDFRTNGQLFNNPYASIVMVNAFSGGIAPTLLTTNGDCYRDFDVSGDYIYAYDKSQLPSKTNLKASPSGDGLVYRAKIPSLGQPAHFKKLQIFDPLIGSFMDSGLSSADTPKDGYTKHIQRLSIDWQAFQMGSEPDFSLSNEMTILFEKTAGKSAYSNKALTDKYKYGPKYLLESLGSILSKTIFHKNNKLHPLEVANTRQKPLNDNTDYSSKDLEAITPANKNALFNANKNFVTTSNKTLPKACFLIVPKPYNITSIGDFYDPENYQIFFKYGYEKICLDTGAATLSFWPPPVDPVCGIPWLKPSNPFGCSGYNMNEKTLRNMVLNIISPNIKKWAGINDGYIAIGDQAVKDGTINLDSIYKSLVYFVDPGFPINKLNLKNILTDKKHGRLKLDTEAQDSNGLIQPSSNNWDDHFVKLDVFFSLLTISGAGLESIPRIYLPSDAPDDMFMFREQTSVFPGDMSPIEYNNIIYDTASKTLNNIDKERHGSLKFDIQTKLTEKTSKTQQARKKITNFLDKTIHENDKNIKDLDFEIYNTQRLAGQTNDSSDRKDSLLFILKCSLNYCIIVAIIFVLKLMFKETFVTKYIQTIIIVVTILFGIFIGLNLYSIRNRSNQRWKLRNWEPGKGVDITHSSSCNGETENIYRGGFKPISMDKEDDEIERDPRKVYCTAEDKQQSEQKYRKKISHEIRKVKQDIAKYKKEMTRVKRDEKLLEEREKKDREIIKSLQKLEGDSKSGKLSKTSKSKQNK